MHYSPRCISVTLLLLVFGLGTGVFAEISTGKSGIPAIDSLPAHDWDVATERKSLGLALVLGVFPGGMQYYFEHHVRGGFLTAFELGLLYDNVYSRPLMKKRRVQEGSVFQDSIYYYTGLLMESPRNAQATVWASKRQSFLIKLRDKNDSKIIAEDQRRVQYAWLVGLHIYGYMDGIGIWLHNQRRLSDSRNVTEAMWKAALVPGWGQLYNDEWGKAGLLYMAYIGATVSFISRQQVVEYFLDRKQVASREGNSGEFTKASENVTFWRKRRNQFAWGGFLIYLYSIADAAVDASLGDFDNPLFITLNEDGIPVAQLRFSF
jgi:hypothetical protein